jgi:hypothetical protein
MGRQHQLFGCVASVLFLRRIMRRCKPLFFLSLFLASCGPSVHPCDYSDTTYKRDLDVRYPPGTSIAAIEKAQGHFTARHERVDFPKQSRFVQDAVKRVEARSGKLVNVVTEYTVFAGSAGSRPSLDILLFDPAGTLLWTYRHQLD